MKLTNEFVKEYFELLNTSESKVTEEVNCIADEAFAKYPEYAGYTQENLNGVASLVGAFCIKAGLAVDIHSIQTTTMVLPLFIAIFTEFHNSKLRRSEVEFLNNLAKL